MVKKNWKISFAVIAALLVCSGAYAVTREKENKKVTNYSAEFEADQQAEESSEQQRGVEAGIEIPGYKSITIPAGTTDVKVELMNPDTNNVYFQISFYLPDTDETIYTSKLIKPGQHLYEITLDKGLDKGEYPLTVKYVTYSTDEDLTPKNGADVNCTLIVE